MRTIIATDPGVVELNWMWLPTFIGMNANLKQVLEDRLRAVLEGRELTDLVLDEGHQVVVEVLKGYFPEVDGLPEYLDGLKFITEKRSLARDSFNA